MHESVKRQQINVGIDALHRNVQLQHVGMKVLQQDFIGIGSEASSKQGAEGLHLKKKYIL